MQLASYNFRLLWAFDLCQNFLWKCVCTYPKILMLGFFKKATFDEISHLVLTFKYSATSKPSGIFFSDFVVFSEPMNLDMYTDLPNDRAANFFWNFFSQNIFLSPTYINGKNGSYLHDYLAVKSMSVLIYQISLLGWFKHNKSPMYTKLRHQRL